jgi:biotin carboxyl carrier protein
MPGRVVAVLVERGAEVSERQGVVVLEAMKMQNEVRAGRSGVVTEVRVASGAAVDAGAVLVVIGDPRGERS